MKTLLINSDCIVGANPEMEPPAMSHYVVDDDGAERYKEAWKYLWQGFVPFEDQFSLRVLICVLHPEMKIGVEGKQLLLKPNTIIEADIEYEVVEQWKIDVDGNGDDPAESRTVLRLKD